MKIILVAGLALVAGAVLLLGYPLYKRAQGYELLSLPSANMAPTILPDEVIEARREDDIEAGDIVIFWRDEKDGTRAKYVSRVIGIGGQTIQIRSGRIVIDEQESSTIEREPAPMPPEGVLAALHEETLSNGVRYLTADSRPNGYLDNAGPFEVPAGTYFVMGDNRDYSFDSRIREFGYVEANEIIAVASVIRRSQDASREGLSLKP